MGNVRPTQAAAVLAQSLSALQHAFLIPLAYDLAQLAGWQAVGSGVLIGCHMAGSILAMGIARAIQPRLSFYMIRTLVVFALATNAMLYLGLAWSLAAETAISVMLILCIRFAAGICTGISSMFWVFAREMTPASEQHPVSLAITVGIGIGTCTGIGLSSLAPSSSEHFPIQQIRIPLAIVGVLVLLLTVLVSLALPDRAENRLSPETQDFSTRDGVRHEKTGRVVAALIGYSIAIFVMNSVEVVASLILETQYRFHTSWRSCAVSSVLFPAVLVSSLFVWLRLRGCRDIILHSLVIGLAVFGAGFLFDFKQDMPSEYGAIQFLAGDFLLYPAAAVITGSMEAFAFQFAISDSAWFCISSIQIMAQCVDALIGTSTAMISRAVVASFGRNVYALMQVAAVGSMAVCCHVVILSSLESKLPPCGGDLHVDSEGIRLLRQEAVSKGGLE